MGELTCYRECGRWPCRARALGGGRGRCDGLLLQNLVFDLLEHAVRIVEIERRDLLRTNRNPDKHHADCRIARVAIVPDVETAGRSLVAWCTQFERYVLALGDARHELLLQRFLRGVGNLVNA